MQGGVNPTGMNTGFVQGGAQQIQSGEQGTDFIEVQGLPCAHAAQIGDAYLDLGLNRLQRDEECGEWAIAWMPCGQFQSEGFRDSHFLPKFIML